MKKILLFCFFLCIWLLVAACSKKFGFLSTQVNSLGMTFMQIPAGSFEMGSEAGNSDDRPVHHVSISHSFEIQTTEVTVKHFRKFIESTGYLTDAERMEGATIFSFHSIVKEVKDGKQVEFPIFSIENRKDARWDNPYYKQSDDYPVVCVSWNDAKVFVKWLNDIDSHFNYRLPTEAEWEYACRAGTKGDQYGEWDDIGWHDDNSGYSAHPVGQKEPNGWGLFDMLGNVNEWCEDYFGAYEPGTFTDPNGPPTGLERVVRGGSWDRHTILGAGSRLYQGQMLRCNTLGFRLARDPK